MTIDVKNKQNYVILDVISMLWMASLITLTLTAQKMVSIGPFTVVVTTVFWPLTYIFSDIFTEVYGFAVSRRRIWVGLLALVFMNLMLWVMTALPPAAEFLHENSYDTLFSSIPRVTFAALIAFFMGELINSGVLSWLKVRFEGRYLWFRAILSTLGGQIVDNILFSFIGYGGEYPFQMLLNTALTGAAFCVLWEVLASPFTLKIIRWIKKIEGLDTYDIDLWRTSKIAASSN